MKIKMKALNVKTTMEIKTHKTKIQIICFKNEQFIQVLIEEMITCFGSLE